MQDQLKNNFVSIALQGQQQKYIGQGGKKQLCLSPTKDKAKKKSPSKKPKPKMKQLIRKLLCVDEFFGVDLCWLIMYVTYL